MILPILAVVAVPPPPLPPPSPPLQQVPTPLVLTGGCSPALDNVEYHAAGFTASGAPYYRALLSSQYIVWDPDCDRNGRPARWVVTSSAPNTTVSSDLDGDGKCSSFAHLISNDSTTPPLGSHIWTIYCESWMEGLLTLGLLPPWPPSLPPFPPGKAPTPPPPLQPPPPTCWIDTSSAIATSLIVSTAIISLVACIDIGGSYRDKTEDKTALVAVLTPREVMQKFFGNLLKSFCMELPCILPYAIGVTTCSSSSWSFERGVTLILGLAVLLVTLAVLVATLPSDFREHRRLRERLAAIEDDLPEVLRHGIIRLLSIDWLLAQPDDYILSRRQDLPADAFVADENAVERLSDGSVAALSYRWLAPQHPDPDGWHLCALRKFLRANPGRWDALMIDFSALPQKERTSDETIVFKDGLKAMSAVYASPRVTVLQHKAVPDGVDVPYDSSGWCTFEQAAASLSTTNGGAIYNLVTGRVRLEPGKLKSAEEMDLWFHSEKVHFYGSSDRDAVSEIYSSLLTRVDEFDKLTRKEEMQADRMLTAPSCKWRSIWIFIKAALAFCALLLLVAHDDPDTTFLLAAAEVSLLLLLAVLVFSLVSTSPIFRSYARTYYTREQAEYGLKCTAGSMCCWDPPFQRASRSKPVRASQERESSNV